MVSSDDLQIGRQGSMVSQSAYAGTQGNKYNSVFLDNKDNQALDEAQLKATMFKNQNIESS